MFLQTSGQTQNQKSEKEAYYERVIVAAVHHYSTNKSESVIRHTDIGKERPPTSLGRTCFGSSDMALSCLAASFSGREGTLEKEGEKLLPRTQNSQSFPYIILSLKLEDGEAASVLTNMVQNLH